MKRASAPRWGDLVSAETRSVWESQLVVAVSRRPCFMGNVKPTTRWQRLRYKLSPPWSLRLGRYELRFGEPVSD